MGLVNGKLLLRNPPLPDSAPVEVVAFADSGAPHLCIPDHTQIQLAVGEPYDAAYLCRCRKRATGGQCISTVEGCGCWPSRAVVDCVPENVRLQIGSRAIGHRNQAVRFALLGACFSSGSLK